MTIQHITLTVAAMTILASTLWMIKRALTPKKQKIALRSNYQRKH